MIPEHTRLTLRYEVSDESDATFFESLRLKLRAYNRKSAPHMTPPEAQPLNIQVVDEAGQLVGGLAAVTYWGWLVIKLLVLDDALRGNGAGQSLLDMAHQEARARGCTAAQTTTYDFQALPFYQKHGYQIVGEMRDFPPGCHYYWLRRTL